MHACGNGTTSSPEPLSTWSLFAMFLSHNAGRRGGDNLTKQTISKSVGTNPADEAESEGAAMHDPKLKSSRLQTSGSRDQLAVTIG